MTIDLALLAILSCPRDGAPLVENTFGAALDCTQNALHKWPVVDGIPVFILPELGGQSKLLAETLELASNPAPDTFDASEGRIHPQVQAMVSSTGGFMYNHLTLRDYPIPTLRWEAGEGRTLLDVGCNWGRWTVAAAILGYRAFGIDPHLASLRAAKHVAEARGVSAYWVCGDARAMPFRNDSFDRAFSYSVVQHFSKLQARVVLREIARVLQPGGETLVQMPNRAGVRSFYHLARRGFREGEHFNVRYYGIDELLQLFAETIGPSTIAVDGYFGLGIQPDDLPIMPLSRRVVIHASELLRTFAQKRSWLQAYADSVYITSRKPDLARR